MTTVRTDLVTKILLTAIAIFLGIIALRPLAGPAPVQAQSDVTLYYVEPGTTVIRRPDGSTPGEGKIVTDLRTGDVWGFPTNLAGAPYPVNNIINKPPVSKPIYLGRYDFPEMRRSR